MRISFNPILNSFKNYQAKPINKVSNNNETKAISLPNYSNVYFTGRPFFDFDVTSIEGLRCAGCGKLMLTPRQYNYFMDTVSIQTGQDLIDTLEFYQNEKNIFPKGKKRSTFHGFQDNIVNILKKLAKENPDKTLEELVEIGAKKYENSTKKSLNAIKNYFIRTKMERCSSEQVARFLMRPSVATKDHIIPYSKNGANNMSNYMAICFNCNSGKDTRDFKSWVKGRESFEANMQQQLYDIKVAYERGELGEKYEVYIPMIISRIKDLSDGEIVLKNPTLLPNEKREYFKYVHDINYLNNKLKRLNEAKLNPIHANEIKEIDEEIEKIKASISKKENAVRSLDERSQKIQQERDQKEAYLNNQKERNRLRSELFSLFEKKKASESSKERKEIERKIKFIKSELDELNEKISEYEKNFPNANTETLEEVVDEEAIIRNKYNEAKKELVELKQQLENMYGKRKGIEGKKELSEYYNRLDDLRIQIAKLEIKINDIKRKYGKVYYLF